MHDEIDLAALIALRRARLRRRRPRRRLIATLAFSFAAVVAAVLAGAAFTGRALVFGSCNLDQLRPITLGENSFLFASDGSLLGVIPSIRNRQPLQLTQMSPWLPKATVAIEDRRFWRHGALDYQGIARAVYADAQAGRIVQGGSTMTQELVRNLYIGKHERTLTARSRRRASREKLAGIWSKQQILAAYLNEVFYGRHAFGAQAGAQTFFSTSARHADARRRLRCSPACRRRRRSTTRCSIRDRALARRNDVLRAMLANGDITAREYAAAVAVAARPAPRRALQLAAPSELLRLGADSSSSQRFGARRVEAGGLQVKTTLDPRMQYDARAARQERAEGEARPGRRARRDRPAHRAP